MNRNGVLPKWVVSPAFALLLSATLTAQTKTAPCPPQRPTVAVGGTAGFESFADPASSAKLRATCKVQLYIHNAIWSNMPDAATKKTIVRVFDGTGPQVLELGTGGPKIWGQNYQDKFAQFGLHPDQVHLNGYDRVTLDLWKQYVDAARPLGVRVISPICSPNSGQSKTDKFDSPRWDDLRAKALYGGGITIDSPPNFFLENPVGYQQFVEEELRWARRHGLQATAILSPNISGKTFPDATKQMVQKLQKDDALPTFYIVENYRPMPVDPKYVNWVGPESNPYSIAAVARWVAEYAPIAAPTERGRPGEQRPKP